MVGYINGLGRWMIVGWYHAGELSDASSAGTEKVQSYVVNVHVSLLMPTDCKIAVGQNNVFNQMKVPTVVIEQGSKNGALSGVVNSASVGQAGGSPAQCAGGMRAPQCGGRGVGKKNKKVCLTENY